MKTALYAGSFDPFTNGHCDILEQAASIFDRVIIGVACNSTKKSFLSIDQRIELIKKAVENFSNVEVVSYSGLTTDFAVKLGADFLVRGIRNSADLEYELQISNTNKMLNSKLKTIFFTPSPENAYISSTIVREIYANNGDITSFVPNIW